MMQNKLEPGLYVAATPIGHLADITERVKLALAHGDELYAEDTRRAQQLLSALHISRPRNSLHPLYAHNELAAIPAVLQHLQANKSVVLISDAGTPAISDPGFRLVHAAWEAGIKVIPLPGPSALTALLSISGFSRWPICFWGFAPAKAAARKTWLTEIKAAGGVAVIYETPHRASSCLADCSEIFGAQTPMVFARELTKQFETVLRGTISDVTAQLAVLREKDPASAKGEMCWAFDLAAHAPAATPATPEALSRWAAALATELPATKAAKVLAKMLGVTREAAYAAILSVKAPQTAAGKKSLLKGD